MFAPGLWVLNLEQQTGMRENQRFQPADLSQARHPLAHLFGRWDRASL
jgi:hypothetical protein